MYIIFTKWWSCTYEYGWGPVRSHRRVIKDPSRDPLPRHDYSRPVATPSVAGSGLRWDRRKSSHVVGIRDRRSSGPSAFSSPRFRGLWQSDWGIGVGLWKESQRLIFFIARPLKSSQVSSGATRPRGDHPDPYLVSARLTYREFTVWYQHILWMTVRKCMVSLLRIPLSRRQLIFYTACVLSCLYEFVLWSFVVEHKFGI